MEIEEKLSRPTKEEQRIAKESYLALTATLESLHSANPQIEIEETEEKIKELTKATIRCIPLNNEQENGKCILTGNPSKERVLFARAY